MTVFLQMSIHQLLPELLDALYSLQTGLHVDDVLHVRLAGAVVVLQAGPGWPQFGLSLLADIGAVGDCGTSGGQQGLPVELAQRHPLQHRGEHHVGRLQGLEERKITAGTAGASEETLEVVGEGRLEERRGSELVVEGREMIPSVGPEVSRLVQRRQPGRLSVAGEEGGGSGVTEPPVFGQRGHRAEGLAALVTLYLHPAVGVHSLVTTQVGELSVGFVADLAPERLDGAVDVSVLLQTAGRRECLPALRAGVAPSSHVGGSDVALQVARVGEHLVAVLTREPSELTVDHFVTEQVWSPGKPFIAMFTDILVSLVPVALYHVFVQAANMRNNVRTVRSFKQSYIDLHVNVWE